MDLQPQRTQSCAMANFLVSYDYSTPRDPRSSAPSRTASGLCAVTRSSYFVQQIWCNYQRSVGLSTTRLPMDASSTHGLAQAGQHGSGSHAETTMSRHHNFVVTGQFGHQGMHRSGLGIVSHFNIPHAFGVDALASEHVCNLIAGLRERAYCIQPVRQELAQSQSYWSAFL